jgi:hypothetical protein
MKPSQVLWQPCSELKILFPPLIKYTISPQSLKKMSSYVAEQCGPIAEFPKSKQMEQSDPTLHISSGFCEARCVVISGCPQLTYETYSSYLCSTINFVCQQSTPGSEQMCKVHWHPVSTVAFAARTSLSVWSYINCIVI